MSTTTRYCPRCLTTFQVDPDKCTNMSCGRDRPKSGWGILLGPDDVLDRHYKILRALAIGGAGITYLARELGSEGEPIEPDLAIKVLYAARAKGPFLRRLANEAQILQELAHENIVEVRGFVHRTGQEPYLVTLFEHGGSLSEHIEEIGGMGPKAAAGTLRQILLALDVAHQRAVVHRDLKPDNILLRERVKAEEIPRCRLTDFGIAKVEGGMNQLTRVGAFVGTPEYAAPEQFLAQAPTPATDIFAAGGVLYYLMTGRPPVSFTHRGDIESSYEELLNQLPPQLPTEGHDPTQMEVLQEVVNNIMTVNPDRRWTVHQVLARLNGILDGTARPLGLRTLELTDDGAPARSVGPPARLQKSSQHTFGLEDMTGGAPDDLQVQEAERVLSGEVSPNQEPAAAGSTGNTATSNTSQVVRGTVHETSTGQIVVVQQQRSGSWLGVGVMGMVTLLIVGGSIVAAVLGLSLWGFGYFSEAQVARTAEVTLQAAKGGGLTDRARSGKIDLVAAAGFQEERKAIADAVQALAPELSRKCGARGIATVDLTLAPRGKVKSAAVDPGYLDARQSQCVARELGKQQVPRKSKNVATVRVPLLLR